MVSAVSVTRWLNSGHVSKDTWHTLCLPLSTMLDYCGDNCYSSVDHGTSGVCYQRRNDSLTVMKEWHVTEMYVCIIVRSLPSVQLFSAFYYLEIYEPMETKLSLASSVMNTFALIWQQTFDLWHGCVNSCILFVKYLINVFYRQSPPLKQTTFPPCCLQPCV